MDMAIGFVNDNYWLIIDWIDIWLNQEPEYESCFFCSLLLSPLPPNNVDYKWL